MKLNKLMGILVIIFVLIMFVGAVSAADNSNGLNAVGADNRNFEVEHNSVSDALKVRDRLPGSAPECLPLCPAERRLCDQDLRLHHEEGCGQALRLVQDRERELRKVLG